MTFAQSHKGRNYHTLGIYRCYVQDRDYLNLRDSSSSQTQRRVNALIMSHLFTRPALLIMISLTKGSACAEAKKSRTKARKRHQFYYSSAKLQLFPPSKGKIPKQHKKWNKKNKRQKRPSLSTGPHTSFFTNKDLKIFCADLKNFRADLTKKFPRKFCDYSADTAQRIGGDVASFRRLELR